MTLTLRELLARIQSFLHWRKREIDFDAELAEHLELAIEDNLRQGLTPAEARRLALVRLGGLVQTRELHRESRGLPSLESLLRDFRYALRTLRRDAALATFAILIVGLGVGVSSTVFSVFDALLLRPLPFAEAERLVWIANGQSANLSAQTVQVVNLQDLQAQSQALSSVAAYSPFYGAGDLRLTGAGEPERLTGVPVTEGFFPLLGVEPWMGRTFTAQECRWNVAKTVVLSYGFWKRRFASDAQVIGRAITLDGAPATVVGVLPESFDFAATFAPGTRADLFVPFPLSPETNRRGNTLALIGRLKPGVDLRGAQAEATLIGERLTESRTPESRRNGFQPRLTTLREHVSGRFRYALLVLAGAVGFLMLLVCANLSNLLLARASARQKEMAIRTALGASRGRLVRQLLIESVVLSCCGAALGLALAFGGTRLVAQVQGTSIPLLQAIRVDAAALAFTIATAVLTGLLFGLAPALQVSTPDPHGALKASGRGASEGRDRAWLRASLVVCQVALACVLLTGAGLLLRSLVRVLDVELGFETNNVMALRVDPGRAYSTYALKLNYLEGVLASVRALPGVEQVGLTDALPLGDNYGWRTWSVGDATRGYRKGERPQALIRVVDDGYLRTLKIALRTGRMFETGDNASSGKVVLINELLANQLWPGQDPIGRQVLASGTDPWRVVGVVGGVRYFGLETGYAPELYLPIRQSGDFSSVDLVVRGTHPLAQLAPEIRQALKAFDPGMPASEFRTMRQLVDHSVFSRRFIVLALAGFALFGLVLASLGIYGVIAYSVSRRRQEIGIRMALGASARDLQLRILMQTVKLAVVGLMLGVPVAWLAARAMKALLFGVASADPATFAAVLVLLTGVAALAGYVPARSASRLNPLSALRDE
ncbi:ADOP family duplicated permease [Paludibaculum fermentans]|uniref:ABC transporter permease n=1 Tax=Paludibaculum fermentans TaxID=1473598 RepID=UPI003EB9F335